MYATLTHDAESWLIHCIRSGFKRSQPGFVQVMQMSREQMSITMAYLDRMFPLNNDNEFWERHAAELPDADYEQFIDNVLDAEDMIHRRLDGEIL